MLTLSRYSPGDIAAIQPIAEASDVDSFLVSVGWANNADQPFKIVASGTFAADSCSTG
jgi:hypothetical protein